MKFWEGRCPEPFNEDIEMCRFLMNLESRIKNKVRSRITKEGYPKNNHDLMEYIQTAINSGMREMSMIGYWTPEKEDVRV